MKCNTQRVLSKGLIWSNIHQSDCDAHTCPQYVRLSVCVCRWNVSAFKVNASNRYGSLIGMCQNGAYLRKSNNEFDQKMMAKWQHFEPNHVVCVCYTHPNVSYLFSSSSKTDQRSNTNYRKGLFSNVWIVDVTLSRMKRKCTPRSLSLPSFPSSKEIASMLLVTYVTQLIYRICQTRFPGFLPVQRTSKGRSHAMPMQFQLRITFTWHHFNTAGRCRSMLPLLLLPNWIDEFVFRLR